jgi:hypothetical protein
MLKSSARVSSIKVEQPLAPFMFKGSQKNKLTMYVDIL